MIADIDFASALAVGADPRWATAVPDWADRIVARRSLVPDLPLFDQVAEKALRIFKRLRVPDMIGTPTYGEVCEPWVFDIVRVIFGAFDPETKARKIRELFLLVPKKNGKSAIAAALIVTAAIMNERPHAELILIAPTQTIAGIAFDQASGIIAADPQLSTIFHVRDHIKTIEHRATLAEIKILSADGKVVTGSKATYVLVDETHVLGSRPNAGEIFVEIRGGLASRPDGFLIQITTQSKKPPQGQFKRELNRARAVRDGDLVLPMLAVLYEFPEGMAKREEWRDPATWDMVNPNLGRSVSTDFLGDQYRAAIAEGRESLALFASQHLNVQVGHGLAHDRWAGAALWQDAELPDLDLDGLLDRCDVVCAGIDGGGLDDLLGLSIIGREIKTRNWLSWSHAYAHRIVLERRQDIAPLLQDMADAGEVTICDRPGQDVEALVALLAGINERRLMPERDAIGLDPEGVAAIIDALIEAGIAEEQLRGVSQGYRLNGAIKGIERKLFDGTFWHAPQELMGWSTGNAKTEIRGNAVLITKAASGTAKIDPLMALFDAATLMALNPEPRPATFEKRGLIIA